MGDILTSGYKAPERLFSDRHRKNPSTGLVADLNGPEKDRITCFSNAMRFQMLGISPSSRG